MSRNTLRVPMTAQKSQKGLLQKSQKAQKGQKGRKTNFKSRRRGRRAATPARLLPALRQTRPPRLRGFHHAFKAWAGTDRPAARGAVLWTWCRCGRSAPLCAPLRPSAGFSARHGISIAPHGLRPSWAALRGCEGI